MRIFADSNVFIDLWRKPTQSIIDTFSSENVMICVSQEIRFWREEA